MIDGKRNIATGRASGMSAALVGGYARAGARLVVLDINPAGAQVVENAGGDASFLPCVVASEEQVQTAIARAVDHLGGLDVLVHAAGICPTTKAKDIDLALFERVMSVNLTGTFVINREVFAHLKAKGGRIINFASCMGVLGAVSKALYAVSKGAVLAWSRSLAWAWGRHAITVNTIAPVIWTPMYDETRSVISHEELAAHDAEQRRKRPLGGKLGHPERDFLPLMICPASDGANFLTGQLYKIDGGGLMLS